MIVSLASTNANDDNVFDLFNIQFDKDLTFLHFCPFRRAKREKSESYVFVFDSGLDENKSNQFSAGSAGKVSQFVCGHCFLQKLHAFFLVLGCCSVSLDGP